VLISLGLKVQDVQNYFLLRLFCSLYKFRIILDIVVRELNLIQLASLHLLSRFVTF